MHFVGYTQCDCSSNPQRDGHNFVLSFFPTYSTRYLDKNTSALIMLSASTRWLGLRGDALSNLLVTSASAGALFATQSPGESSWT